MLNPLKCEVTTNDSKTVIEFFTYSISSYQMSRIRDYSANQLDRVHENYIFQRQRLRKFSAQNYLRVQVNQRTFIFVRA